MCERLGLELRRLVEEVEVEAEGEEGEVERGVLRDEPEELGEVAAVVGGVPLELMGLGVGLGLGLGGVRGRGRARARARVRVRARARARARLRLRARARVRARARARARAKARVRCLLPELRVERRRPRLAVRGHAVVAPLAGSEVGLVRVGVRVRGRDRDRVRARFRGRGRGRVGVGVRVRARDSTSDRSQTRRVLSSPEERRTW